ncbi:ABC transporter substrate-binding protein [Aromatoleum diolicum]|uniref:ABC transporter substrate-binding protein n=1 Tax=Aromatoleum diolicum TaxID=75796 RepID=A0ABX1QHV3_9RHOO|nr:ABC transporter substrate-binding protein [Aromatoleum diolicum]NMG77056.1 ABC transporter substrate-binding protein [Aromatoleum diolicum]
MSSIAKKTAWYGVLCVFPIVLAFAAAIAQAAGKPPVLLAIDAEFGVMASTSAQAIQRGAEIAAAEINAAGGVLDGRPLQVVTRNNNSVPARATENLRELAADPDVVAVMSGKYSPVVQQNLQLIHEIGMPYLLPWAAADVLTEHPYAPDFVFRLSMRDSWAIAKMIGSAEARGYRRIGLILPNSGWGRSNRAAVEKLLDGAGRTTLVSEQWYNFGDEQFQVQYDALRKARADVILLVANELEGAALVAEIARRPASERVPVLSHWGVTGGEFFKRTAGALAHVDFSVVQTYSFIDANDARARRVFERVRERYGVSSLRHIESPVGFAHAYDLTHLLARAVASAGSTDRRAIRGALEQLGEYRGLVRHYRRAFTPTRHEALDAGQVFMARYAPDGAIVRVR